MNEMDECIVCLIPISNTLSAINSNSREWQEFSIQHIIEKHLWWWCIKQSNSLHWICQLCWQELLSFHKFFTRVQNAHRQYDLLHIENFLKANREQSIKGRSLVPKQEFEIVDDMVISGNVAAQDNQIKNFKTEPFKEQSYDSPDAMENDGNWQTNICDISVETECKGNIELIVKKEEVDISERSLIANNDNVRHLDTSKTKRKKKVAKKDMKDAEAGNKKNNVVQCIEASENEIQNKSKKVETNQTKKRKKKQDNTNCKPRKKVEAAQANCEYIDKSGYKFTCHLCNIILTDFRSLKAHYRSEHSTEGYAVCCNKKFYNRATLADHLRVHEDPNYFKCQSCGKILSNRISYETHMAYHKLPTNGHKPVYNCSKCDTVFLNKASFTRHSFLHVPAEERKFQCDECNKKFGAEHLLKLHKTFAHLKKYCKICEICGKSFRERFSFKRHMDEHNGKPSTKVPCDICGVELTNKYLLNRHKKLRHIEENMQQMICPHCAKVSPNLAAHRQHVFYNHTLEPKHECHICDKKFKLALKLKEHLSTHTGEPLFTCSFCSLTFISKTKMYRHRKDAHPIEWQEVKPKYITTPELKALLAKRCTNSEKHDLNSS